MIQYMHDMNGDATATGTDRPGTGGETGRGTVIVGESLGLSLGLSLGSTLGETLGESLGEPLGESLGLSVGETVGYFVGAVVTSLKSTVTLVHDGDDAAISILAICSLRISITLVVT